MTAFEVVAIIFGAVTVLVVAALIVANLKLTARINALTADHAELAQKLVTLRDQNQQDLLTIGQHVLEADKIVRRFSERLDGIENNSTAEQPQYGQLQNLLKQTSAQQGEASAAEIELLSLLTRRKS